MERRSSGVRLIRHRTEFSHGHKLRQSPTAKTKAALFFHWHSPVTAKQKGHSVTNPNVAICIVSFNEAVNLVNVLDSLSRSVHHRFAVFICETGGTAGFDRSSRGLDDAQFLDSERPSGVARHYRLQPGGQHVVLLDAGGNLGYAGGNNAAIRAALADGGFDAFWVLNADTFPEPEALQALIDRQASGSYGIVGSRIVFKASGLIQMWGGFDWNHWLARGSNAFGYLQSKDAPADVADIERRMEVVCGASMFVTKDYIDHVGLMDESLFLFCEDSDWCLRRGSRRLGYAHESVVHHIHGSTTGSSTDKKRISPLSLYLTARNRIRLVRKQFGVFWPALALLIFADLLRFLIKGTPAAYGTALKGWWAGVRGEGGPPPILTRRGG